MGTAASRGGEVGLHGGMPDGATGRGRTVVRVESESLPDGRTIRFYTCGPAAHVSGSGGCSHAHHSRGPQAHTERRYDPTHDEWVTFAVDRQDRTYQTGATVDAACPLCPTRPGRPATEIDREHFEIAVFDNRFPTLSTAPASPSIAGDDLVGVEPAYGRCEVVVFTEDHDATLAELGRDRTRMLVEVWADRFAGLAEDPRVRYVLPFENKGEAVGVTLSHPHGQIYAYAAVPPRPARELAAAARHRARTGRCVFCDVVAHEDGGPRVVAAGEHFLAGVPPWARWPYEVDVWSRAHVPTLPELGDDARDDLADVLARVLPGYDAFFGFRTSYLLGVHSAPVNGPDREDAHLHLEIAPPHRGAGKLKHLAGAETFAGEFAVDVVPEVAAQRLRTAAASVVVRP